MFHAGLIHGLSLCVSQEGIRGVLGILSCIYDHLSTARSRIMLSNNLIAPCGHTKLLAYRRPDEHG